MKCIQLFPDCLRVMAGYTNLLVVLSLVLTLGACKATKNETRNTGKTQNLRPLWGEGLLAPFSKSVEIVDTQTIFEATTANEDAFNHMSVIARHQNKICIAFTTHMNTEEGDGQYVRYAYSLNGGSGWSAPMTLFAPPCEQSEKKEKVAARAAGWAEIDNDLYAIIHILRTDGMLAIKINPDNSFGTPFWIYPAKNQPAPLDGRPPYTYDPLLSPRIMDYLMETSNFPVRGKPHEYFEYTDRYIEPSGIVLPSGYEMLLWRWFRPLAEDKTINPAQKRKYLQYRQGNKGKFSDMAETEIIDSRSVTKWKVLSDGKVGIIGNDTDPRRTALFYSEADPYKLEFKPVYNLVSQVDYQVKFPGGGKNGGASYVDFIEYNNMIICVYSERKEDIKVTRFLRPKK